MKHYPHDYCVVLPLASEFSVSVLVDNGSVEMLINGGEFSFTNLAFARNTDAIYAISVDNGDIVYQ